MRHGTARIDDRGSGTGEIGGHQVRQPQARQAPLRLVPDVQQHRSATGAAPGLDVIQDVADHPRPAQVEVEGTRRLPQQPGHIVNVASTAAKRAWPNASAYHASKWGLLGLSQALHAELRPHGIKVTSVIAGGMRTPFLLERFPDIDVGTLQDPADVAAAIKAVLLLPAGTVVPEIMVLPMRETSWP